MKKIATLSLAVFMTFGEVLPVLTLALTAVALTPSISEALPVDRAAGRQGARYSRQTGREVSRARRRGCYTMPAGAVLYPYRGVRYYRVGPRYYYPYMYGGRTVYIDIEVNGGYPAPPPAAGSIDIDIYM